MFGFWDSVFDLRRIELVILLVAMITPVLCGTVLLSLRHRIKTLLDQTHESQGLSHSEMVHKLETEKQRLAGFLGNTQSDLSSLRRQTAPRQISTEQEEVLIQQLRGIKAAPVIVAAYSFEEESKAYASQIAGTLRKAGWDVVLSKGSMNDFKGLSLGTVNLMHRPLSGLKELADAFAAAHLDLHQHDISPDSIVGSLQDGSLLVVVGRK